MAQVYWEEQESGFCGVHCTNNLLQGPYFTEVDFSTIALEMDEAEKKLMMVKKHLHDHELRCSLRKWEPKRTIS